MCKLVDEFELSQSKLSYHLKLLLDNNLIVKISQGKWNYYDINKETLKNVLNENIIEEILKVKYNCLKIETVIFFMLLNFTQAFTIILFNCNKIILMEYIK
ncbi:ArsR family transcriptional regulator [Paraclostridium bifermentans]|nr:ArsR family transcriptional regulator [Paraclostridium bifermentans]